MSMRSHDDQLWAEREAEVRQRLIRGFRALLIIIAAIEAERHGMGAAVRRRAA